MASIYDKASLVLIPSGTKTSKVYSQKPTNGDGDFTFSRSTAATRVNASGNIEKETQNLLTRSKSLNIISGGWGLSNATSDTAADFDGGNAANELTGTGFIYQPLTGFSGVHTFSVYVKAGTWEGVRIRIDIASNSPQAYFNLSTGVLYSGANYIDAQITDVGNDWYRITITGNVVSPNNLRIYPVDTTSVGGTGNIILYKAQGEQGLVARDYIETTTTAIYGGITDNVPRLDYTDSSCPALLLEPQRTNIVAQSEYFDSWAKIGTPTITTNYGTSPEGIQNSTRLQGVAGDRIYLGVTGASATYTYSIYAKGSGTIKLRDNSGSYYLEISLNSEWTRYDYSFTTSFTNIQIQIVSATADAEIYGTQVEAGSYATSYIPTYGSAVTRNQDDNGLSNVADLIGQTEGTMFFEGSVEHTPQNVSIMNFDRSTQYSVSFLKASNDKINAFVYNGGSSLFNIVSPAISGRFKCAIAYKSGDTAFYVNGTQIGVNTTTFTPAAGLDEIYIGSYSSPYFAYDHPVECNQALVFKTRLSNEELATLTTI